MRATLLRLTLLLVLVAAGAGAWLWQDARRALDEPLAIARHPAYYVVKPGASLTDVARDLAGAGWLRAPHYLVLHGRLTEKASGIKAGEYLIPRGTTPRTLLDLLISGRVVQHSLTLVEGWTFRQVLAAVAASNVLDHKLTGLDAAGVMERLGLPGVHPEGRFLADTYHFPRDTTDVEFLLRAYRLLQETLAREWREREPDLPLRTPNEALILASIIEKETALAEERGVIAGVFLRRLRKGMRLETDPTVIYGLGESFDGNLRRKHLRQDTPYNTYVHKGLPPTPIAITGIAALHAVLHPQPGNALFFVSKGNGSHHFSATYREHREAVDRYQRRRRKPAGG